MFPLIEYTLPLAMVKYMDNTQIWIEYNTNSPPTNMDRKDFKMCFLNFGYHSVTFHRETIRRATNNWGHLSG